MYQVFYQDIQRAKSKCWRKCIVNLCEVFQGFLLLKHSLYIPLWQEYTHCDSCLFNWTKSVKNMVWIWWLLGVSEVSVGFCSPAHPNSWEVCKQFWKCKKKKDLKNSNHTVNYVQINLFFYYFCYVNYYSTFIMMIDIFGA